MPQHIQIVTKRQLAQNQAKCIQCKTQAKRSQFKPSIKPCPRALCSLPNSNQNHSCAIQTQEIAANIKTKRVQPTQSCGQRAASPKPSKVRRQNAIHTNHQICKSKTNKQQKKLSPKENARKVQPIKRPNKVQPNQANCYQVTLPSSYHSCLCIAQERNMLPHQKLCKLLKLQSPKCHESKSPNLQKLSQRKNPSKVQRSQHYQQTIQRAKYQSCKTSQKNAMPSNFHTSYQSYQARKGASCHQRHCCKTTTAATAANAAPAANCQRSPTDAPQLCAILTTGMMLCCAGVK